MKAIIQRVNRASVEVDGQIKSQIGLGYLVLLGVMKEDTKENADNMAKKLVDLRIFEDENEKMSKSIKDVEGEMLVVSQFTICSDLKKGNRPSFDKAMAPNEANELYEYVVSKIREQGVSVKTGVFGAYMKVALENDGPVTFVLER